MNQTDKQRLNSNNAGKEFDDIFGDDEEEGGNNQNQQSDEHNIQGSEGDDLEENNSDQNDEAEDNEEQGDNNDSQEQFNQDDSDEQPSFVEQGNNNNEDDDEEEEYNSDRKRLNTNFSLKQGVKKKGNQDSHSESEMYEENQDQQDDEENDIFDDEENDQQISNQNKVEQQKEVQDSKIIDFDEELEIKTARKKSDSEEYDDGIQLKKHKIIPTEKKQEKVVENTPSNRANSTSVTNKNDKGNQRDNHSRNRSDSRDSQKNRKKSSHRSKRSRSKQSSNNESRHRSYYSHSRSPQSKNKTSRQKRNRKNSRSRSRSASKGRKEKAFTCCNRCKKNDKGGRTCICVVPASQRRSSIGISGCQTCGCKGCSKEDEISTPTANNTSQTISKMKRKGSDIRQNNVGYKMQDHNHSHHQDNQNQQNNNSNYNNFNQNNHQHEFEMKNGCCKQCLKAFSKSGKACLCQVPEKVRKTTLPKNGCKYCGCKGCNPEDTRQTSIERQRDDKKKYLNQNNANNFGRDRDKNVGNTPIINVNNNRNRGRSYSQEHQQIPIVTTLSTNENEFIPYEKTSVGKILINDLKLYASLVGYGIPQRSYSYIMGKPQDS